MTLEAAADELVKARLVGEAPARAVHWHEAAAALPHVDVTKPQKVIGTNTVACMQAGVFWGYVGLVREITTRIKGEYDRPMKVISTGGLAPLFAQGDTLYDEFDEFLTIHGLRIIYDYNREQGNV